MSKSHRTAALLSLTIALAVTQAAPARSAMGLADDQAGVAAAGQLPTLNAGIPAPDDVGGGQMKTDLSVAANAVFSGTYNVGAGQPFTSLTNLGGIFGAINAGALSGNVIINITSDLTGELGTNALNEWAEAGAGGYSLLIRPSGAPHTITGSINDALIRLNGADRVTLDGSLGGGKDRSLTIQNTNPLTSAMVIALPSGANGAQNNTLKNLTVLGQDAGTTRAGIALSGAPGAYAYVEPIVGGAGNHGNRVENCAVGRAQVGIYSAGELANPNIGTVITQNDVGDVSPNSVTIMTISRKGIVVLYDSGVQITQNRVGVVNSHFEFCYCVGIGVGSYAWGDGGVIAGGETTNAFVSRNYIVAVQDPGTRSVVGIAVNDRGSSTVVNNIVVGLGGLRTNWYSNVTGIGVYGSIVKVYNNAVVMHNHQGMDAEGNTFGIANFGGTISLKNNSIDNTISNPFAFNGARPYAVGSLGGSLDSDYNHFLASPSFRIGTTGLRPTDGGVSYLDLASWQAAVSQDAHSFVVVPGYSAFLAPNDFHRRTGYPLPYVGTPLAEVTEDFDGEPRVAPYDIGPDQVWIDVAVAMAASPALLSPGAAVTYTLAFSSLINAGPSVATGAVISDRIPLSVTITGVASSTFGSGVRITQTSGGPLPSSGPNFAWALSDLAVGEGGFITLTGFLDPAATGGLITNTATITASDDLTPTNNSAAATFTIGVAACYATPDAGAIVFASIDGQAVQSAIDAAGSGGTVKIAGRCVGAQSVAGASQTGYISKSLTLRGGYTNTVSSWAGAGDPAASPTTLDAAQAGRALYITGGIDVAIQSLRLTGGSATAGGGVYNNAARTTISNTLIHSNSAASGGGVRNQSAGQLTLDASTVVSNAATSDGGGLLNIDSGSVVTLTNGSRAQANTAGSNGGGLWNAFAGRVFITASIVASNTAGFRGGGVYNQSAGVVSIDGSRVVSNAAAANGGGINNIGGVIGVINGSLLGNNTANAGGGLLNEAAGQVTFDASALAANTAAASGGGIYNTDSGSAVTLTQGSRAEANGAIVGAGLWNGFAGQVTLDASAIVSNTASNIGGGVYNAGSALALANGSRVEVNVASAGGGIWNGVAGQVTLEASTVASNTATASGGGINNTGGAITITRGILLGNKAANGGGIYQFAQSPSRIVNALFARNSASSNGAAIYVDGAAPLSVIHTTIVSPTAPAGATQAVYVAAGTVQLSNTLIATHTIGIARVGGTAGDWNTLFAGVSTPYNGAVTSVGGITGTAGFVNPAADDYHLGAGSAAINAGIDAGVNVDIDGQARPQAGEYDIGYDESPFAPLTPRAYLPLVVR